MGESIKRDLTPTIGQDQLQNWLASPRRSNPLANQSTELKIVQELFRFQRKYRLHQDSVTIGAGESGVVFSAEVPQNESWEIDRIWIEHNDAAARDFQAAVAHNPFFSDGVQIAREIIAPTVQGEPLFGGGIITAAATAPRAYDGDRPYSLLPGGLITISNIDALAVGNIVILSVLYRLVPLPLEVRPPVVGLWTGDGVV